MHYDRKTFLTEFSVCFGADSLPDDIEQDKLIAEVLGEPDRNRSFLEELDRFITTNSGQIGKAVRDILHLEAASDAEAETVLIKVRECVQSICHT